MTGSSLDNNKRSRQSARPDDWTLPDLLKDIWAGRLFIGIALVLSLTGALLFYAMMPGYYRLSVIISPALKPLEAISAQNTQDYSQNYYAPAAFLKNNQRDNRRDKFTRLVIILDGQAVAQNIAKTPDIQEGLHLDRWQFPDTQNINSAARIKTYLDQALDIRKIGDTSMRRLIYHSPSPEFGQLFLQRIIRFADDHIKARDKKDMLARINYLKQALKQTANAEQRKAIASLLTLQEQRLTLLETDQFYAAQILDPPSSSPKPVWPSLWVLLSFAILGSIAAGYISYVIWRGFRSPPSLS